jgi:hypothetical protein
MPRATQDERFDAIFSQLERAGQDPRDAGRFLDSRVIRASHRARPGRFDIYVMPCGGWTHDAARVPVYGGRASII